VISGHRADILEADISGVQDALKTLTEAGAIDPVIKATVVLSESGFANVQDVVAYGEIKDESITGKLKSMLNNALPTDGSESESEKETVARPTSTTTTTTTTTASSEGNETTEAATDKKEKEKEKPKDTIPLKVEIKWSSIPPMSTVEKRTARDRCV
jgi:hypoxia up-regulated 1